MGIAVGKQLFKPGIVYEDLIINLDALNPASYSGTGENWYDTSGYNNHCFLSRSLYTPVDTRTYIDMNDNDSFGLFQQINGYPRTQLTIETMVYYNQLSGNYGGTIGKWTVANNEFIMGSVKDTYTSPGYPNMSVVLSDGSTLSVQDTTTLMQTGSWYHQVGTFDGNTMNLYLNGRFITSSTIATTKTLTNNVSAPFFLGGFGILQTVTGPPAYTRVERKTKVSFAQFRMYKKALTGDQVLRNYNAVKSRFGLT